mmetsp:Transcript_231/g.267  ORF Transcript_231/g.267 Transcript_231/m.267 type:complete len:654 (-) Transcript_231:80-2041(-)
MGAKISKIAHGIFQKMPFAWHSSGIVGLIMLIVHRTVLEAENILAAPPHKDPQGRPAPPQEGELFRPDDGYGTDVKNPTTAMEGAPVGRNMSAIPKEERVPRGGPNVQVVAQRLLARESFTPAGDQLNIVAAGWIQAMVHDWMKHEDGKKTSMEVTLAVVGSQCPLHRFNLFETKERPDGHYNSERTNWWDASFVYGQNAEQVQNSRAFVGGKLKVNEKNPDTLPSRDDGTDLTGDQSNSWVGVSVLQTLFLYEHNYCAEQIAKENPTLTDDQIYGHCRNIIAALVAKIHTIDWTVELLKTPQLKIGMRTNWMGIIQAITGLKIPFLDRLLRLIKKKENNNEGVPFCLTEEFAAVYRLHPLLPPGLIIEGEGAGDKDEDEDTFIDLRDTLTTKGRDLMRKSGMAKKVMKAVFTYPCGNMSPSNYPDVMRDFHPTDLLGNNLDDRIDLAAIDLFRDRERGIQYFNNFRRKLSMKPFQTWEELTGDDKMTEEALAAFVAGTGNLTNAKKLELVYGAAPKGIEHCDLLVGDLYEKKIPGFAISETSFMIFLLMASRRLDADPYLNEYFDEEHYTPFGLQHVEDTESLRQLLKRHFPELEQEFPAGQSGFKPTFGPERWKEQEHLYPDQVKNWNATKKENDEFFRKMLVANVDKKTN